MDISVLIPTFNEAHHIGELRQILERQDLTERVEFLFIDGRSEDGTRDMIERLAAEDSRVRLIDNPARHIPNALNAGLAAGRGEFIARMDAHTIYPLGYLRSGLERLRRGDVEWVSGAQLAHGVDFGTRVVAAALATRLGIGGASFRREVDQEVELDTGYLGVLRRSTLERIGGWQEAWEVNEDGELAARIRADGGRIVCIPEMASRYIPRGTAAGLARQYLRFGAFRVKTSRAHPESMRRSHLIPPLALLALASTPLLPRRGGFRRLPARAYGLALGAGAVEAVGRGASPREVALVPLVLATIHMSWAVGFLRGCSRFGVPLAAIGRLVGLGGRDVGA